MSESAIILIPVYHHINYRLQELLTRTQFPCIRAYGNSDIALCRSRLLTTALQTKATRFLWLDADMVIEEKDLFDMLTTDAPLLSGVYVTADCVPCLQTAPEYVGKPLPESGRIPINWAGFGCVSMAREVAEAVVSRLPYLKTGVWPAFFPMLLDESGKEVGASDPTAHHWYSEDMSFFKRARDAGYQAELQCDVRLGHLKEIPIPVMANQALLAMAKGMGA